MANPADIQIILRFLTQESKIPLAVAIPKVKQLQKARLLSVEGLAKADLKNIYAIFDDEKLAKQVHNAAKRAVKKRSADGDPAPQPPKKSKSRHETPATPAEAEAALGIPIITDVPLISNTTIITNRAPLVLAFAFILLKYTMPEQPTSSRFSLAQAIVSANSRSKAASLGIEKGPSAEDDGWGRGQPSIKLLGREISVLRRAGYSSEVTECDMPKSLPPSEDNEREGIVTEEIFALWGLDLESLRKSNGPAITGANRDPGSTLPIYKPEAARDYLLKSCDFLPTKSPTSPEKKAKKSNDVESEKLRCVGLLLGAISLVCQSWASILDSDDLDRRAWAWYLKVRPEVQVGPSGWGQKGALKLSDILDLRRS